MAQPPYVHQAYPSVRYHANLPPRTVKDPDDEAALGPGWVQSPALIGVAPRVPDAVCPTCGQVVAGVPRAPEPEPPPASTPRTPPVEPDHNASREDQLEAEARATQFGMSVSGIDAAITSVDDVSVLERIRARERLNPSHDGGRKGVLHAVDRRIKGLSGIPTDATEEPVGP